MVAIWSVSPLQSNNSAYRPGAKWRGNYCQKPLLAAGQTMSDGRCDGLACDSAEAFISMSGVERPVFMSTVFD
jgi:hypothetical protein